MGSEMQFEWLKKTTFQGRIEADTPADAKKYYVGLREELAALYQVG